MAEPCERIHVASLPIKVNIYHQGEVSPEKQLELGNELKALLRMRPPVGLGLPESDIEVNFYDGSRLAYTVQIILPEELLPMVPIGMDADGILRHSLNHRYWRDDFQVRVVSPDLDAKQEIPESADAEVPTIEVWHASRLSNQRKAEVAELVQKAFGPRFGKVESIKFLIDEGLKYTDKPCDYNIVVFLHEAAEYDPTLRDRLYVTERTLAAFMRGKVLNFSAQNANRMEE